MIRLASVATLVAIISGLLAVPVNAVCPVCTVAVGAGLGFTQALGIDDTITGIWIGGLIVSSGLWIASWLQGRNWKIIYPKTLSVLIMVLLVIPPLYLAGMIGREGNMLWGIDKVFLGSLLGIGLFLLSVKIDQLLRKTNEGKVYIYYQKVIIPVFLLSTASLIFYFVT